METNDHLELLAFHDFVQECILNRQVQGDILAKQGGTRAALGTVLHMIEQGQVASMSDAVGLITAAVGTKPWNWINKDWQRRREEFIQRVSKTKCETVQV